MAVHRPFATLSPAGAALVAMVAVAGLWLGSGTGRDTGRDTDAARAATLADGADAGVVALSVRTLDGVVMPLRRAGEPSVVMVSSETCQFCKAALRDMGRVAAGRPLRRLRLVTLEGPAAGVPMVRAANVTGATLAGPVSSAEQALLTFQIRGTPTFVALDDRGRVTRSMVGYPGVDEMRSWIGVMLGERDRP
jgi:hypothetical protein